MTDKKSSFPRKHPLAGSLALNYVGDSFYGVPNTACLSSKNPASPKAGFFAFKPSLFHSASLRISGAICASHLFIPIRRFRADQKR